METVPLSEPFNTVKGFTRCHGNIFLSQNFAVADDAYQRGLKGQVTQTQS